MPGTFIVIEGPDGAGTTKHSTLLAESLQREGYDVVLTWEPTDEPIGACIRTALRGESSLSPAALQLLFCADRAQHVQQVIQPALQDGKIVVCDRYVPSTLVYGKALLLDVEWLRGVNAPFPQPDVLLLTLPGPRVCRERMGRRETQDSLESEALQRKVYEGYEHLAREDKSIVVVDTSVEIQEAHRRVLATVKARISK